MATAAARRRWILPLAPAAFVALSALALLACPATGLADSLYWSDPGSAGTATGEIRSGALAAGGAAESLFSSEPGAGAIALNPDAGTIYWTDSGSDQIRVGSLDGQGLPQTLYTEPAGARPTGLAINAAAGELYWTDEGSGEVREAPLAGGATPQTLYAEPAGAKPAGLVVSSGAGKLYWADRGSDEIRVAPLASGGAAQTLYAEPEGAQPSGLAIDSSAGRLYWTDEGSGEVRFGPLGGGTEAQTVFTEPEGSSPRGIALDPETAELYWADAGLGGGGGTGSGAGQLRAAAVSLAGPPSTMYAGEREPGFPVVLAAPSGAGAPKIAGHRVADETLTCGKGKWASNLPGASFYRSPQLISYQWWREGSEIAGAQSSIFTPTVAGAYACTSTASNAAGSSAQTSEVAAVRARPPLAAIASPASGGTYVRGTVVATAFSCAEGAGGPGLASCRDSNGDGPPAGHLGVARLGEHTYTVTAVSIDGRRERAKITYTVIAPPRRPVTGRLAPRPPRIAIKTARARVMRHRTRIVLVCAARRRACSGRLTLSVRVKRHVRARPRRCNRFRLYCGLAILRARTVRLASTSYDLVPGAHGKVSVHLGKQAMRLLRDACGRRLVVRAKASARGGRAAHRRIVLVLRGG